MALKEPGSAVKRKHSWEHSYARRLFATDLAIILVAVFGSQAISIDGGSSLVMVNPQSSGLDITYTPISLILAACWMAALDLFATRDHRVIGTGSNEYRRIADATIRVFGVLAIVAYLLQAELARGYVLLALPGGLVLLLIGRWAWRQWLRRRRREGGYSHRALLLGHRDKTAAVAASIMRDYAAGIRVVGALTPGGTLSEQLAGGVPVLGTFADAVRSIDDTGADALILTGADDIQAADMKRLGWQLEGRGVRLIVAPALTDIAGPRIHARPVAGLPLVQVDFPTFEGRKYLAKRSFDLIACLILVVVSLPVAIAVAVGVKLTSPGPIFYRQERIGVSGRPFRMFKFRSMVQGADDQLQSLLDAQGTSDRPLFKVLNDSRITPFGSFIRKYSLDELPQLINVVLGDMSLVGPRPQREAEVALYDAAARRRLLMKPGMSGLWQVSGRSNLGWEDAVRLDLYYVENWSLTGDLVILWKTFHAVARPSGAI